MTPEERQMLAGLFERIGSAAATPRDPQAEAFINDAVRSAPYAPYVLAQTVLVQQQALENASRRLAELEAQAKAQPQEETSFLGSLGKSLFGGGSSAPSPAAPPRSNYDASAYTRQPQPDPYQQRPQAYAPPPAYAQPPQAGPWGAQQSAPPSSGGGFMQSALTTAAGVAGGVVLAHSLGNLFGGHSGGFGLGGGGLGGGEVVNNYYEAAPDAAGQHAQDVLQDQDQDQDDAQDAYDDSGSGDDSGSYDT
jgi:hypothetical protein